MFEAYSLDTTVASQTAIPLNNVTISKGCAIKQSAPATIQLNKCGVYEVSCNAAGAEAITVQLYKDGVAQPQAQSTGTTACFTTFVQVDHNNSDCCCASPTILQVMNMGAEATLDINVCVNKIR